MVNHRTAALSSLPFASLPSSFIHLRTAAPEHFNACQQYVQQTCCACKQTHTHLHKITHSYTLHTHTHTHSVIIKQGLWINGFLSPFQNKITNVAHTALIFLVWLSLTDKQFSTFQNKHCLAWSLTDDTSALISTSQLQSCTLRCQATMSERNSRCTNANADEVARDAPGAISPVRPIDTENMSSNNPLSSVTSVYMTVINPWPWISEV